MGIDHIWLRETLPGISCDPTRAVNCTRPRRKAYGTCRRCYEPMAPITPKTSKANSDGTHIAVMPCSTPMPKRVAATTANAAAKPFAAVPNLSAVYSHVRQKKGSAESAGLRCFVCCEWSYDEQSQHDQRSVLLHKDPVQHFNKNPDYKAYSCCPQDAPTTPSPARRLACPQDILKGPIGGTCIAKPRSCKSPS